MTPHRDIDRILDVWLDDGPVVLPERALSAALETIEHTRQQRAVPLLWRFLPMIALSPRRLGMPLAVAGALAILVVTAGAFALLQGTIVGPRLGSAPAPTLTIDDVRAAVLAKTQAPAGTTLQREGVVDLSYMAPDPELRAEWSALGLRASDTWQSYFSGGGQSWVTSGMVWADAATAEAAFEAHRSYVPVLIQGENEVAVTGLGDQATCYSFAGNAIVSGEGAMCLFRIGNATFFVPGSGAGVEAADVIAVSRSVADGAR